MFLGRLWISIRSQRIHISKNNNCSKSLTPAEVDEVQQWYRSKPAYKRINLFIEMCCILCCMGRAPLMRGIFPPTSNATENLLWGSGGHQKHRWMRGFFWGGGVYKEKLEASNLALSCASCGILCSSNVPKQWTLEPFYGDLFRK